MLNIQSVKEIETLCAKIASRNNISFHDAFECLSEEQQAVYDEYMTCLLYTSPSPRDS